MAGIQLSFISPVDQARYESLFKGGSSDGTHLSAVKVKELLSRSNLEDNVLAQIWDLSNFTKAPQLTLPEFSLAMYLTSMKMTGQDIPTGRLDNIRQESQNAVMKTQATGFDATKASASQVVMYSNQLPQSSHGTLPGISQQQPNTYQSNTYQPGTYQPHPPGKQIPTATGSTSSFGSSFQQVPMTTGSTSSLGSYLPQVPMPTGMYGNNLAFAGSMMPNAQNHHGQQFKPLKGIEIPWAVTSEEKKEYTKVFEKWDTEKTGCISGEQAKEIFSQSGLANNVLEQIWKLSDIYDHGKLNKDEFAVAMHLIYRKVNGYNVPTELPIELIPPSTRGLKELENDLKNSLLQNSALKKSIDSFGASSTLSPPRASSSLSSSTTRSASSSPRRKKTEDKSEDDIGDVYISSARRLVPSRGRSSESSPTPSYEYRTKTTRIRDLKKQIADQRDTLQRIQQQQQQSRSITPLNKLSRQDQADIDHLKGNVRTIHAEIASREDKGTENIWKEYEQVTEELSRQEVKEKSVVTEIDSNISILSSLLSQIKEVEEELKNKKMDALKRQAPESSSDTPPSLDIIGTGPNGEVTEKDRITAKAKAMVAARMGKKTSQASGSSPSLQASEIRKIEEDYELFMIHVHEQTNQLNERQQAVDAINAERRMMGQDVNRPEHDWENLEERRRFEEGSDVAPDLSTFIKELIIETKISQAPNPDPTFESRFPSFD